jgi:hypothetical protein
MHQSATIDSPTGDGRRKKGREQGTEGGDRARDGRRKKGREQGTEGGDGARDGRRGIYLHEHVR